MTALADQKFLLVTIGLIVCIALGKFLVDSSAGRVYVKQVEGRWVPADELDREAGIAKVSLPRSIGLWCAALFTLWIMSFMYRDNPFYKIAEAVVVGVSAAYWMVVAFWTTLIPNLFGKLVPALVQDWAMPGLSPVREPSGLLYIFPLILGVMLLMRLSPQGAWISRWPLAFIIGTTAGLRMIGFLDADFLSQINNSMVPLVIYNESGQFLLWETIKNWIMVLGIFCCLVYFFFSIEHKGVVGGVSRVGIWVLMITFGAAFGYTVMGRIALLAIRLEFLFNDWMHLT